MDTNTMPDQPQDQPSAPSPAPSNDMGQHKIIAIIGYIIPIIFFVPLLSENGKKSAFAMFHANQQLVLLITWLLGGILTFILIGFLVYVFAFVCAILGIVSAGGGTMKPLPLIGGIKLLK